MRVSNICRKKGSAIIFSECLCHGTLPWRGSEQRRTAFFKYVRAAVADCMSSLSKLVYFYLCISVVPLSDKLFTIQNPQNPHSMGWGKTFDAMRQADRGGGGGGGGGEKAAEGLWRLSSRERMILSAPSHMSPSRASAAADTSTTSTRRQASRL